MSSDTPRWPCPATVCGAPRSPFLANVWLTWGSCFCDRSLLSALFLTSFLTSCLAVLCIGLRSLPLFLRCHPERKRRTSGFSLPLPPRLILPLTATAFAVAFAFKLFCPCFFKGRQREKAGFPRFAPLFLRR